MKRILPLLFVLLGAGYQSVAQEKNSFAVQVAIENGLIEGNYDTKTGIQKYFGIPFAQPPVGSLRWKAPQPLSRWDGIKATKAFGARPMQKLIYGDMNSRSDGVSEDCLYLNVWTPASRTTKDLPVLVYFYGGGNMAGDASEPRYDGESMAQKGIVVVTCNYRLGIFGYLAHSELSAEAPYHASGNYGALDQLAALQWVKRNIATFGGSPNHVTIAGESAGSIGVSTQMASPLAKGLIHGAIGESGAAIPPTMAPIPLAEAEKNGQAFLTKAGIKSIADLRKLSSRDIYEMQLEAGNPRFPLVIDNYFLPKSLIEIFEAGEQSQIPLLAGWNSAEIPGNYLMQDSPMTKSAFEARVKQLYPNDYTKVLALYPHNTEQEVLYSATDLASDRFIVYSTWKWINLHLMHSNQPVYRYLYAKPRPPLVDNTLVSGLAGGTQKADNKPVAPLKIIGAPHACEIEYAMGNLDRIKEFAWTVDDYQVSNTMQSYFANFIKTGNPNADALPVWSVMKKNDTKPIVMRLNIVSKEVRADTDARYQLLDMLGNTMQASK